MSQIVQSSDLLDKLEHFTKAEKSCERDRTSLDTEIILVRLQKRIAPKLCTYNEGNLKEQLFRMSTTLEENSPYVFD